MRITRQRCSKIHGGISWRVAAIDLRGAYFPVFLDRGLALEVLASVLNLVGMHHGMNYGLNESDKAATEMDAKGVALAILSSKGETV